MNAAEVLENLQIYLANLPAEVKGILSEINAENVEIEKNDKASKLADNALKKGIKSLEKGKISGDGLRVFNGILKTSPAAASSVTAPAAASSAPPTNPSTDQTATTDAANTTLTDHIATTSTDIAADISVAPKKIARFSPNKTTLKTTSPPKISSSPKQSDPKVAGPGSPKKIAQSSPNKTKIPFKASEATSPVKSASVVFEGTPLGTKKVSIQSTPYSNYTPMDIDPVPSTINAETDNAKTSIKPVEEPYERQLARLQKNCEDVLKTEPHLMALYQSIEHGFKDNIKRSEHKIALADQGRELMERHIKRMELELERLEEMEKNGVVVPPLVSLMEPTPIRKASMQAIKKHFDAAQPSVPNPPARTISQIGGQNSRHSFPGHPIATKKLKKKPAGESPPEITSINSAEEEKYCICQRGSFGEMVACDNETCKIEWYHLECVGLKTAPLDGEVWYCSECKKK